MELADLGQLSSTIISEMNMRVTRNACWVLYENLQRQITAAYPTSLFIESAEKHFLAA